MKLFVFRCKKQRHMFAASRYETGSNLPADRCNGGWEFFELLYLSATRTPNISADVHDLRRGMQQQGWYVWETRTASAIEITPAIPSIPVAPAPKPVATPPIPVAPAVAPEPVAAPPEPVPVAAPPPPRPAPPAPPPVKTPPPPPPRPAPVAAPPPPKPAPPRPAPAAAPPPPRPAPPPPPAPKPVPVAASAAPAPAHVAEPPAPRPAPADTSPAVVQPAAATAPDRQETMMKRPAHQIVWFDIPVRELERAVRFYSAVLGAPLETVQAGFGPPTIALLPHPEGAITGSLVQTADAAPAEGGPLVYLSAEGRLDEAVAAVQANGGKVVHPRHSIGSAGSRAIVIDSEGNRIALHST